MIPRRRFARALELARRLNLLQDVHASENNGKPLGFAELRERLEARGVNLSEGRWAYMLTGEGTLTTDSRLLSELTEIFEVDASYLLDWDDPELTRAHPRQPRADRGVSS